MVFIVNSFNCTHMSTTLFGPRYSWERGGEESFPQTNTNSKFNKTLGRCLFGAGGVWWGTVPENPVMAESILLENPKMKFPYHPVRLRMEACCGRMRNP